MIALSRGRSVGRQSALMWLLAPILLVLAGSAAAAKKKEETRSIEEVRVEEFEFDIPRSARVLALETLSDQADQIMVGYLSGSHQEEGTLVGPLKGRFTLEGALRVLLRSSTLHFRWIDATMISVEAPGAAPAPLPGASLPGTGLRPSSFDVAPGLPEEVLVLGWPIRDLSLSVSPVVVMDRSDLDAVGAPTLSEALRNLSQTAFTRPEGYRASGAQYAEMRGLGADSALVLINGRRTLPSANSIAASAFDLNSVPITAVERIELVLDSASAAYGTDAIGGIINIVLRDKISRPEINARYGAADGGAQQERMTFSGGINQDKLRGVLVLDYFDSGSLRGYERALWRNQDYTRFGGRDFRSLSSDPGNISALAGNLPGLDRPVASVPLFDATPPVTVADFQSTENLENKESLLKYSSVVPEARRLSVIASAATEIAGRLALSADVLYANRQSTYQFAPPLLFSMPVPASNAFNPFGTTVLAHRLLAEYPPQYQFFDSDLLRSVAAVRGRRGRWDWEVSALYSKEETDTWVANLLDLGSVASALASSNPATALNPFTPGAMAEPDLLRTMFAPRDVDMFASEGKQLAGFIQGPIYNLRSGPVMTVLGGEWRNESVATADEGAAAFDRNRDVVAAFVQLRVPLVGEATKRPWFHELSFSGGTRWDHYGGLRDVVRSQLGLAWKPHPSLKVHLSGSGSFRPPSLYELYLPQLSTVARVNDPTRNELAVVRLTVGGNDELRPSTAKSYTAGVVFTPETATNWKLSANYWRIDVRNRALALPPQLVLANEAQFRGRITRDSDGVLRSIDASRTDVGGANLAGIDFGVKADVLTDRGRFTPELSLTWFDKYQAQDIPNSVAMERVGVASQLGSILEWRAIFSMRWSRGPYGLAGVARYTPSYDDAIAGVRVGREVAAQTQLDVHASLNVGRMVPRSSPWDDIKLWVGISNLLDAPPSFAEVGDAAGFDLSQGDLKGRSWYVRFDKQF
ncbi:MAG TPA: TonB-dependent receptor [Steroidobacter sp.]|uniref:TonB-dependent receptor domain-containing protein n=1 Tax=Steroidobacter sp. TaxID=1978227 RepID=UPI002ED804D6